MHRRAFSRPASILATTLVALSMLGFAGCGEQETDGRNLLALSGTVSLDGEPLPDGMIQWIPTSSREGTFSGAVIKDGKFSIDRKEGLAPGGYRVEINRNVGGADPSKTADGPPGLLEPSDAPKNLIPAKYNTNSILKAELKAGTPNTFEFPGGVR
jgi:hypothetical protein